jgi:hypothetical protein
MVTWQEACSRDVLAITKRPDQRYGPKGVVPKMPDLSRTEEARSVEHHEPKPRQDRNGEKRHHDSFDHHPTLPWYPSLASTAGEYTDYRGGLLRDHRWSAKGFIRFT